MKIIYKTNTASEKDIKVHLTGCAESFSPPLYTYVSIEDYGRKLSEKAVNFEAWHENQLVGLASAYFNDIINKAGFLSNLSILPLFQNMGIASKLTKSVIEWGKKNRFKSIELEVKSKNLKVIKFYEKHEFVKTGNNDDCFIMTYYLK